MPTIFEKGFENISMFPKDIWSILQNFHCMFFIDIDLISNIFKILWDGSSDCFGSRLFQEWQQLDFQDCEIYKNNMFLKCFGVFMIFFRYPSVSKNQNSWFLGAGDTSENPEVIEIRVFVFSHKQIETKMDRNISPELVSLSFT